MDEKKGYTKREFKIASRPVGSPKESNWEVFTSKLPELKDGEVLLKSKFISVDPYLRGALLRAKVGDPMSSGNVAEVVESRNPKWKVGDIVMGYLPWADYFISSGKGLNKVDTEKGRISSWLGLMGITGMSAYFGLLKVGEMKKGENVFISGAAGSVGSIAGQIAKIYECNVVGSAGSSKKVDFVKSIGFDDAFNYHDCPDQKTAREVLSSKFPKGIDVYFDNVGGHISDAVFDLINDDARIVICGQISQYNQLDQVVLGPRFLHKLIYKNATIKGFLVGRFLHLAKEYYKDMGKWIQEGKIEEKETIIEGFENIPSAFIGLFKGINVGKLLVKIED